MDQKKTSFAGIFFAKKNHFFNKTHSFAKKASVAKERVF